MPLSQGGHSLRAHAFSEMCASQHSSSHKDFEVRTACIWTLASSLIALAQLSSASSLPGLSFLVFKVSVFLLFGRHLFYHYYLPLFMINRNCYHLCMSLGHHHALLPLILFLSLKCLCEVKGRYCYTCFKKTKSKEARWLAHGHSGQQFQT